MNPFQMKHRRKFIHPFLLLGLTTLAVAADPQTLRVYFIGNSVTDTVRYGELAKLAAARDVKLDWGRTMIPGAPLEWIYTHPNDGFQQEPYGTWKKALNEFAWDAVSLQPFDRHLRILAERVDEVVRVDLRFGGVRHALLPHRVARIGRVDQREVIGRDAPLESARGLGRLDATALVCRQREAALKRRPRF